VHGTGNAHGGAVATLPCSWRERASEGVSGSAAIGYMAAIREMSGKGADHGSQLPGVGGRLRVSCAGRRVYSATRLSDAAEQASWSLGDALEALMGGGANVYSADVQSGIQLLLQVRKLRARC
jgi:hypothetical protein